MKSCTNCNLVLSDEYKFCPECSQNTRLHRLSIGEVIHQGIHFFTHADKGVFQLLRDLTLTTGTVAREYVDGRRKRYFPPLNFFLLVATIYVLVINLDGSPQSESIKDRPEIDQISDPVQREKLTALYDRRDKAIQFIQKHSNLVSMASLPLSAFFFWLFYRRGRYNYTEHLVAGMYMSGFTTLLFTIAVLANLLLRVPINYVYALFFVMQIGYFANFYYRFMNVQTKGKAVKAFFASFISVFCLFLTSGTIVFLYMARVF